MRLAKLERINISVPGKLYNEIQAYKAETGANLSALFRTKMIAVLKQHKAEKACNKE